MTRIEAIIEQLELDFLERVNSDLEERKKMIPITEEHRIKSLIWNLLVHEKYRQQMSGKDYQTIMQIFFNRIKNQTKYLNQSH